MNEWSPGGNYTCPGTPSQNGRSLRSQKEESGRGAKPLVINIKIPENRSRNFQQHSMEDVSKGVLSTSHKKGGNGKSDPRFKRVVPTLVQINDACVGTEVKNIMPSLLPQLKEVPDTKFPMWNAPEFKPNGTWVHCIKNSDQSKLKTKESCEPACENLTAAEDSNVNQSQDHLKAVDKLSFNHDMVVKSVCKESVSECTVNTRNTSMVSGELPQEFTNTLERVPPASRVNKVENWIFDHGPKLEKKHSVITVIGQMQEPDTLSSALQEIDKRRKLVKELDKYAVCKKILETDKEKEISDLMVKISSLNNNESVLFSGSNETFNTNTNSTKDYGGKQRKQFDPLNAENTPRTFVDLNVDSSSQVSRKSAPVNKKFMKNPTKIGYSIKGKLQMLVSILPYQRMFCILFIMSGILSWLLFFSIQKGAYVSFDLFNSKPKPITWYERLCSWIWEFFRPANNYHRTTQWPSY